MHPTWQVHHPLLHLVLVNLTIFHISHPGSEYAPQVWEMVVTAQSQMKKMKVVMQVLVGVMLEEVQEQELEGTDVQLAVDVMV
jgi:hypothetical protein